MKRLFKFSAILSAILPQFALAQSRGFVGLSISDLVGLISPVQIQNTNNYSPLQIVILALNILLLIGAVLAIFYLIWAGIKFITSQGDPTKTETARKQIYNTIIGIIVIVASYAIVQYVSKFSADFIQGTNAPNGLNNQLDGTNPLDPGFKDGSGGIPEFDFWLTTYRRLDNA